nr:hypothetical protein [Tanacetum cinerariifolium]
MPLVAHMLHPGEPAFKQAQQQDVSQPPPSPVVGPHPLPDPMPSPPRTFSPPPIPFGPAPTSGVVSTEPIPDTPSSSGPSEPVLETINSLFGDDDTGGGSFHESPPRPPLVTLIISPTFKKLDALLDLANAALHEPSLFTTPSKPANPEQSSELETSPTTLDASSSGLDFADANFSAGGVDSAGGLDSTGGLVSASGVDSAGGLTFDGILVAAGPIVPAEPSSPFRDPSKGKAVATPSSPAIAPTAKELADQQAAILEADRQELLEQELHQSIDAEQVYLDSLLTQRVAEEQDRESMASAAQEKPMTPAQHKEFMRTFVKNQSSVIYSTGWTWKDVRGLTDDQLWIVYDKIRSVVDLATAKDHHQHLKRSGETLESLKSNKLKSSHSTTRLAELQETTSVFAGATITAGDPILAVTSVSAGFSISAASFILVATPIATGVSTPAGASGSASEAFVPIIVLLDSGILGLMSKMIIYDGFFCHLALLGTMGGLVLFTGWTWKDVRGLTDDQLWIVYDKIRSVVDLATAKDHHQHLKRSGETLESLKSNKLKSSHSTTRLAELQETTSVFAGATITAGDPILAVTSVSAGFSISAASFILVATPIATGVSTPAGASGSASLMSKMIIYDGFFCHLALLGTMGGLKLDNKQVTIQFRGGLLGIVIPTAIVFCFCWQVFIPAGDLFLLAVLHYYLQVSKILPKIEKTVNEQLEAKVLTRSSNSSKTSYAVAVDLSELELKKILIKKMESNKDTVTLKRRCDDVDKDEEPSAGSDRGSKRKREGKEPESTSAQKEKAFKTTGKSIKGSKSYQKTASESAPVEEPMQTTQNLEEPSHQEFETGAANDQPIAKALQHPECDLAKQADSRASFNELMDTPVESLVELEFFLEEVYKATTDKLDWNNPEAQQYPHNLLKPLLLIPNSRGHRVIPFDHFINNDLKYLCGGTSNRKYITSVTKTKAADFGHIKWIEDLGRKRQQFYGFAVNRESAQDVYSKRRIIVVTKLQIVEWHDYKRLDWITVRTDDEKLYKFKEGDLKRLGIQDIEDMLLPLNKDKQNMLMHVDELHKFDDGTLNDVRTALDDRLKGIRMKYLPQTIWRRSNKERAPVMIQAIDKQLKTRMIIRSL